MGGVTLKSEAEQLPDSDHHLALPMLGWMGSLRCGPSVACGGVAVGWEAVTNKDGGPSAGAGSWCLRLSTCGADVCGHQLSRDGGLPSWHREPPPALQPEPGAPWGCWRTARGLPSCRSWGCAGCHRHDKPCHILSGERSWLLCHHSRMAAV